jgi:hypothetical protein
MNITITILDIIHRPVFYLKHDVSNPASGPETETNSIYWAEQSRFHLKTETESSLRNIMF